MNRLIYKKKKKMNETDTQGSNVFYVNKNDVTLKLKES